MSGDIEHRDLVARLRVANERMRRLREEAGSADNVIRFRVERHLEAAEETLGDLNVRATDMPAAGSYARRLLERGLRRAESEIVFAEAKLEAARAEESDDRHRFVRATRRAMSAQRSALFGRDRGHDDDHGAEGSIRRHDPSAPVSAAGGDESSSA
jgi:hypothetical protein